MNKNNNNNQFLYDDQNFIKKKINALYALMFTISSGTKLPSFITCLLVFLEDIQLLYFAVFDKSVINLYDGIRNAITLFAYDDLSHSIYYYTQGYMNVVFLVLSAVIAIYIFFIPPEKYKENIIIKCIRITIILFYTVFFPFYTHLFAKTFIPKNGMLAAYPDVPYFGDQILLFIFTVLTFTCFLILQFGVFPFIYVNPTPFKKNNSLCQIYSFSNFKYHILIVILCFLTLFLKAYLEKISHFIFIFVFIFMLYSLSNFLKTQPYYNRHVNLMRSGTWSMIVFTSIVDLFSFLFGPKKIFFGITLMIVGVFSFFGGVALCWYRYNKQIEGIYKRFKQKKIEDKARYNRKKGISSESSESEDDNSRVSEDEDNESNLISIDSYDSDGKEKHKKKNKKESKNELNNEESDEEEYEYDGSNSDGSNVQLNDRISERITAFGSIPDILNTTVLNEPVIVYNSSNEFELACRFLSKNETNEAFRLMKELYEESIKQYAKEPFLYTYYAYYLLYIDQRTSKSDKDIIMGLHVDENSQNSENDENNESSENVNENEDDIEKDPSFNEDDINGNDPDFLLSKALTTCKLNFIGKYFVRYLLFEIKEKKKEDKDYYKKEALELLMNMQRDAVEKHITILNLLKKFFTNIKFTNSVNNSNNKFDIDKYLELIYNLKEKTLNLYQEIIAKYPEDKSTYQLYTLYMTEIINQTDMDKYALNEGDSFMALNVPESRSEQKDNSKKSTLRHGGSVNSLGISNTGGSAFGGDSDLRKRKLLKNNMIHSFTDKNKLISKFIIGMFILIIILFIICSIFAFVHINNFNKEITDIEVLEDMNFTVHRLMRYARLLSFSIFLRIDFYIDYNVELMKSVLDTIEDSYIPILKKYSLKPASEHPVIIYSTNSESGTMNTELAHLNGYELMRKVVLWGKGIVDTKPEEWVKRMDEGENILLDYKFRTFEDNYQYYFYNVFKESIDTIYNDEIENQNKKIYIIYALTGCLIILSLAVNYLGITPLYKNLKELQKKTLRIFKYLLKGSINEIISKFEIGMESITETYDIGFDSKKNKADSVDSSSSFMENLNKMKGYIINFLLLGSIIFLTLPIILKDKSIIKNLNYNLSVGERKLSIININVFVYETLLQDARSYLPGVAESYLNREIQQLENLQTSLYSGSLGLESTTKMRYLDSLLIDQKCRLEENICETFEEYIALDVTRNIIKLNLNELIDEFLTKAKSVLYKSHVHDYKNEDHIYNSNIESDMDFILKCFDDTDFLFQFYIIDHLGAGLLKYDKIVYNNMFTSIRSTILFLILIFFVGMFLIIVSFIISIRSIKKASQILNELVNMIFVVPTSTVNMIPQFKRFIETGSFEEE